tara:strand:+ start:31111 stop:32412 length:1302 start_codon:yes stop_codon:yes gene_type:complete
MNSPATYQKESLRLIKKYLSEKEKCGVNISLSPLCDFITWTDCIGKEKIKLIKKKENLSLKMIYFFIKEFFFIKDKYKEFKTNNFSNNGIKNVILSYCQKKDFDKKGNFKDKIFNCRSNKQNTIWFLISLDDKLPPTIKKNIVIIYRKKSFSFLSNLKFLFENIFKPNFFHVFNSVVYRSNLLSNIFIKNFENKKFNFFLAFENKPHQNALIHAAKKLNKENYITGYLAPLPWSFQADMIYKKNDIDRLLVGSKFQKKLLIKDLCWPQKKILVSPSFRYKKINKLYNSIFLPYEFTKYDEKLFLKKIRILANEKNLISKKFLVRIHPHKSHDKNHINLKNKIILITKGINKTNQKKLSPIVLGATGSVVAECLQATGKVIHIPSSIFDYCTRVFFKNLIIKKLSKNIYIYKMSKKIKFVNFSKNRNFANYLNN